MSDVAGSYTILHHVIRCHYSGLMVGTLDVHTTAGALPYLTHWDKCIAYHPVFSLSTQRLLKFTETEWTRLGQRVADEDITDKERDILCVSYLALLHTLDCVKQDEPGLPPLSVVYGTIGRLVKLVFWKWKLESERFRFPTLHMSKINNNLDFSNLPEYLDLCFDIKRDYETNVREIEEQEKVKTAERAILALNSSWVTPTSKKLLWSWVKAHLPSKYAPDAEGWLSTLFLGGSAAIVDFDKEDIELALEIISAECPAGTGVMFAVRERLKAIQSTWEQFHETFSIDLEDYAEGANLYVNGERVAAPHPGPEPQLADFSYTKHLYYVAHAKWSIAKAAYLKTGGIL